MKCLRVIAAALLLLAASATAGAESCGCTAADESCSASVTCVGGCISICPGKDTCVGRCVRVNKVAESPIPNETLITFKLSNDNVSKLVSQLARMTGREVVFKWRENVASFNVEFKDTPLWDVLEVLSRFGTITINGIDFDKLKVVPEKVAGGERMSMCVRNATVRSVMDYLSLLTGMPLAVASGDAEQRITLKLRDLTAEELVMLISQQADVKIVRKDAAPASKGTPTPRATSSAGAAPSLCSTRLTRGLASRTTSTAVLWLATHNFLPFLEHSHCSQPTTFS